MQYLQYIIISLSVLVSGNSYSQCPSGNVVLTSQAEVNQFILDYPSCNSLSESLIIGFEVGAMETDIENVSGLSILLNISADLIIRNNPNLTVLTGLNQLTSCEDLVLVNNGIGNIIGLNGLVNIDGNFTIKNNDSLYNFVGLDNLSEINNNFEISNNDELISFEGIETLIEVHGSFDVFNNKEILNMEGLNNLNIIESYFSIQNNNNLTSLDGLNDLLTIVGVLYLSDNENLETCEVPAVCTLLYNGQVAEISNNSPNCNSTEEVTIACSLINCNIDISSFTKHSSCGLNNGSITISDVVGNYPFEYNWSTGDTTQSLTGIPGGIYNLTITDDLNCTYVKEYVVDSSFSTSYTLIVQAPYCDMENGEIFITDIHGSTPFDILWSNSSDNDSLFNLASGNYMFTITDHNGCLVIDSLELYSVPTLSPNISAVGETSVGSEDGVASVNPSDGLPPYTVLWSTGDTTFTIEGLVSQYYVVTVTDENGCQVIDSVEVSAFSCLSFQTNTVLNPSSCFGSCDGTIDLEVTGGTEPYTYNWDGIDDTTAVLTDLCFGLYFFVVTDVNNCSVAGGITSFQPSILNAHTSMTNEIYAGDNNGTATIDTIYGGVPPYSILWSNGDTLKTTTNLEPAIYYVTIEDDNLCSFVDTIEIEASSCPAFVFVDSIRHNGCIDSCKGYIGISNVSNGIEPYSFNWSNGSSENVIDFLCEGDYTVTIVDSEFCETVKTFTILQDYSSLSSTVDVLYETSYFAYDAKITVAIEGGISPIHFEWIFGDTSLVLDDLGEGIYDYIITDASGCSYSNSVVIPVYRCSIFELNTNVDHIDCYGLMDGEASFMGIDHLQKYDSIHWNTGSTDSTIVGLNPGLYILEVIIDSTCTLIDSLVVESRDELGIQVDSITHLTDTTTASIAVSSLNEDVTYFWNGPEGYTSTTSLIEDLVVGCYNVEIQDTFGCTTVLDSMCIMDFTVGVEKTITFYDVEIFPNPVIDRLHISYDIEKEQLSHMKLSIYSVTGKKLVGSIPMNNLVDVSFLETGTYFLKINSDKGQKLIVFNKF